MGQDAKLPLESALSLFSYPGAGGGGGGGALIFSNIRRPGSFFGVSKF